MSLIAASVVDRLRSMLSANFAAIAIPTADEERAVRVISEAAAGARRGVATWSICSGLSSLGIEIDGVPRDKTMSLDKLLSWCADAAPGKLVLVLFDAHEPLKRDLYLTRLFRETCFRAKTKALNMVLVGANREWPPELAQEVAPFSIGLPDAAELATLVDSLKAIAAKTGEIDTEKIVRAALGLTRTQAENALSLSLAATRTLDEAHIYHEKRRLVASSGVLRWIDAELRTQVGGLEVLQRWLWQRKACFGQRAVEYGLPSPKGALLVGPAGCGKSMTARLAASIWRLPLLRIDASQMHGWKLGESEAIIRQAIETAEAVAPCVLWIDEIEKLFGSGGASGRHEASSRQLGYLLTWMQERTSQVVLWATANSIDGLPPELLRKGRFDELFACDLPAVGEAIEILRIHAQARRVVLSEEDLVACVMKMRGFSGAEIEAVLIDAMTLAFSDGERPTTADDLKRAIAHTRPMSVTMSAQLDAMRQWAKGLARSASGNVDYGDTSTIDRFAMIDRIEGEKAE